MQEWRYLEGERREEFVAERRRYEERIRALFREGRELGELRSDLDENVAALLFLSAANWAYTWLRPGADTDALADRFYALLVDGMRGYSTPADRVDERPAGNSRAFVRVAELQAFSASSGPTSARGRPTTEGASGPLRPTTVAACRAPSSSIRWRRRSRRS